MPGRIRQSDVEAVKAKADILEIVGDYVQLKRSGNSWKGLSPFKDERTPSFHVRPHLGLYHCFSTGKGGDVYSFLQEVEHLSFVESVERVASRIGYELHYEDADPKADEARTRRTRILGANQAAAEFFRERLVDANDDAGTARRFLQERKFDKAAADHFGIGYAPNDYTSLIEALGRKGFSEADLVEAGLAGKGDRGAYPRFRGRLVWPIRDVTGQTVGFGARKLFESDNGPKYLNTPETPVYRKSQVLYGLDLARRDIGGKQQVVVVEGYTDVMAAHLAGVTTAVATCGTAFGSEHISAIRRLMNDSDRRGEVVFTFDPDAAGQNAAVRAFQHDAEFVAQPYVAIAPDGLDPCDLRIERGDDAVRELITRKQPLFEFVLRRKVAGHDLNTVEGRLAAVREAAPVIAGIRDEATKIGYAQPLARMIGIDPAEVLEAIRLSGSRPATSSPRRQPVATDPEPEQPAHVALGDLPNDPMTRVERDALMAALQEPQAVGAALLAQLVDVRFSTAALGVVRDGIVTNLDTLAADDWVLQLADQVPAPFAVLVKELAFAPLPLSPNQTPASYATGIVKSLLERELLRQKAELLGRLQRTDAVAEPQKYRAFQQELARIETERRGLRED